MTDIFKLIEKHGIELHGEIEYFAELIRADEREACAKVCDEFLPLGNKCAYAIRARGQA